MLKLKNYGWLGWFFLIAALVAIDQLSKLWVVSNLNAYDVLPILPSLQFILAANKGIAFSFLSNSQPLMQIGLIVFILAICLILGYMLIKTPREDLWSRWSLALMLGGALGNLSDRIVHGHVIDFIDFYIGQWHWYTFNLADVFITFGALMMAKTLFSPTPKALNGAK